MKSRLEACAVRDTVGMIYYQEAKLQGDLSFVMKTATQNSLAKLLAFLHQLEEAKIWYRLEHIRDSLMVAIAVPGERWEIEFFENGQVEVERFVSAGEIEDEGALDSLLRLHGMR